MTVIEMLPHCKKKQKVKKTCTYVPKKHKFVLSLKLYKAKTPSQMKYGMNLWPHELLQHLLHFQGQIVAIGMKLFCDKDCRCHREFVHGCR